uniref:(northern house mosquito) hypothetical protein n=1 Tax=Culex pipiens TaxID=7175 RepID=A0A8D8JVD0_CULPI
MPGKRTLELCQQQGNIHAARPRSLQHITAGRTTSRLHQRSAISEPNPVGNPAQTQRPHQRVQGAIRTDPHQPADKIQSHPRRPRPSRTPVNQHVQHPPTPVRRRKHHRKQLPQRIGQHRRVPVHHRSALARGTIAGTIHRRTAGLRRQGRLQQTTRGHHADPLRARPSPSRRDAIVWTGL